MSNMGEKTDVLWNRRVTLVAVSFTKERLCKQLIKRLQHLCPEETFNLSLAASRIRNPFISEARPSNRLMLAGILGQPSYLVTFSRSLHMHIQKKNPSASDIGQ